MSTVKIELVFDSESISGTNTKESDVIYVGNYNVFGIWVKADSSSNPNLLIKYLVSYNNNSGFTEPESPSSLSITDTDPHQTGISIPLTRYMKIKVEGKSGNPSDTKIKIIMLLK